MNILFREANKKDIKEIVNLTNNAYAVGYKKESLITKANDSEDKLLVELSMGSRIFVVEKGGKIVGAVRCKIESEAVLLYKLAVMPQYRKQGIGGLMMQKMFDVISKLGFKKTKIEVAEEKRLVPYYEKLGFKITERKQHGNHHEVMMYKDL